MQKQRHYFANKGPSSQGYGFSSGHVWMWELDYKESWAPKNWCFWTVVLEETLKSPLDCKEIQPVHPKGDQSWVFTGKTDTEAETPIFWPSHERSEERRVGKEWKQWLTLFPLGSKITADGGCSHESRRRLLPGRKVMSNLDSILKRETLLCRQRSV